MVPSTGAGSATVPSGPLPSKEITGVGSIVTADSEGGPLVRP